MFDCAKDPLLLPRAEVPLLPDDEPDVAAPRLAELEPGDGLCVRPEVSGQSAEEPSELLLPVPVPLRLELVPLPEPVLLVPPLEDEPEPMEPDPLPVAEPLGAVVPDCVPPDELPLVWDQPGWSEKDIAPANASALIIEPLYFMDSPFSSAVEISTALDSRS